MHNNTAVQNPTNFITQVQKEDEHQSDHDIDATNLFKCCSYFWKCFPFRKTTFTPVVAVNNVSYLLPPQAEHLKGRKVLVLDLDETLVHSTFDPVKNPDLILPVIMGKQTYRINVLIRPGTKEFLAKVGETFEVVVFTASLSEYAEPLVKALDTTECVSSILYRQHCTHFNGVYVKDMTLMGRDMKDIILVDNSPNSFLFQPENAYHIKNFFEDKTDTELERLLNFLDKILEEDDIRPISQLREKIEDKEVQRRVPFVKNPQVADQQQSEIEMSDVNINIPRRLVVKTMATEEINRNYQTVTEPDLRKEEIGDFIFAPRGHLTDRAVISEKSDGQGSDSSAEIELPSPKESDNLINHRDAGNFYDSNSSDSTLIKEKKTSVSGLHVKSMSKFSTQKNVSTGVEDSTLVEANKGETVRFLDNGLNLNSPGGRGVRIEFNNNNLCRVSNDVEVEIN